MLSKESPTSETNVNKSSPYSAAMVNSDKHPDI